MTKKARNLAEFVEIAENDLDENGNNRNHFTPKDREYISVVMRGARIVEVIFVLGLVIGFFGLLIYSVIVNGGI